ncbi:MAG: zinc ribbon domain-containing protein [Lachnoclostridium sp.]|nr:zinc ribbon domain-containing protein [Lachnospira sp.]MCM1248255.1 zinc ribbon domain-containing protein [Lachnoclostridium sp.]MCM1535560.1 zinc ribbon domain-containing protein [Clostridium sp.]
MFCGKCGKELEGGSKFCSYCGEPVQTAPFGAEKQSESVQPMSRADSQAKSKTGRGGVVAIIVAVAVLLLSGVGAVWYFMGNDYQNTETEDTEEKHSPKKEDTTKQEPATISEKLSEYLEKELVPQYGYADLSAKVREVSMDEAYDITDFMAYLNGIAVSEICDLDSDGREELLVLIYKEGKLSVNVYELTGDAVAKQAETEVEGQLGLMTMGDEVWALTEGSDEKYVYFEQHYSTNYFLADGVYDAAGLIRYDGGQLYTALLVEHSWGSANFTYRAIRFDGKETTDEIIYDGEGLFGPQYDEAYYLKRMPELFAEYGIEVAAKQNLQVEVTTDTYEEILKCSQWVDGRINHKDTSSYCDTIVIHYNDEDGPLNVYERFLRGEESVYIEDFASERTKWTLPELLAKIKETYAWTGGELTPRVTYAYMDCGGDGYEEMQLKFTGLDIYSPGDDSSLVMVLTAKNGRLEVIATGESWARSYTDIDYYGCITDGGSNGAGSYSFGMQYIDGNSQIHTVYDANRLGGWWLHEISQKAYKEAFPTEEPGLGITGYDIDGDSYYAVDNADLRHLSREEETFIALCEEEGMEFVSGDNIDTMISERKKALGIKEEWDTGKGLYWNSWWQGE